MAGQLPAHFGPFDVKCRIGRGGMGSVYCAVNRQSQTPVAVKMLAEPLAEDENFRQRFDKEIEALRQLRHPNIVRLLGYGQEGESYYYVMELVEGHSLEEEIRSGRRFSWRETLALGIQVASALNCAHMHGIIHRDLKPANLLLATDGTVKLSDFGIATLFGSSKITSVGSIVGTLNYMAPEQAAAQPVTTRSDLFSLGAVLTALMTGKPPFTGATLPEIIHQHSTTRARRPSQLGIEIPIELDELIGRLLERDPDRRPRNAYFVLRMLEAMQEELDASTAISSFTSGSETGSVIMPLSTDVLQQKIKEWRGEGEKSETVSTDGNDASVNAEGLSLELELKDDEKASRTEEKDGTQEKKDETQEKKDENVATDQLAKCMPGESNWFESFDSVRVSEKSNSETEKKKIVQSEMKENADSGMNSGADSVSKLVSGASSDPVSDVRTEVFCESGLAQGTSDSDRAAGMQAEGISPTCSTSATSVHSAGKTSRRSFFREEKPDEPRKTTSLGDSQWGAILMVLVLFAVSILFIAHMIRTWAMPPKADVLYEKILNDSEDENLMNTERFIKNVELFLICYSSDPRAKKVQEFQSEIDLNRLEKQLLLNSRGPKFRTIPVIERDYLNAVSNLQSQPEETLAKLENFIIFYDSACDTLKKDPNFSRNELMKNVRYLEVAKRQVFRIRRVLEEEKRERREILRREVANALALLDSEDPEDQEFGQKLRTSILTLYEKREPEIVAPLLESSVETE